MTCTNQRERDEMRVCRVKMSNVNEDFRDQFGGRLVSSSCANMPDVSLYVGQLEHGQLTQFVGNFRNRPFRPRAWFRCRRRYGFKGFHRASRVLSVLDKRLYPEPDFLDVFGLLAHKLDNASHIVVFGIVIQ